MHPLNTEKGLPSTCWANLLGGLWPARQALRTVR